MNPVKMGDEEHGTGFPAFSLRAEEEGAGGDLAGPEGPLTQGALNS